VFLTTGIFGNFEGWQGGIFHFQKGNSWRPWLLTHVLHSTWPLSQPVRHACMTMTILDAVPFLFHFAYLFQVCNVQNKTNYHPHCRRFYHTASQAVVLYGKNLHSIAKQSLAILPHSEFLELWWQSMEPIAGMHVVTQSRTLCFPGPVWCTQSIIFTVKGGLAVALVRWGGKIKYTLTAYFHSNIYATNYRNRTTSVKIIASQRWDVFWDSVHTIIGGAVVQR